MVRRILITLTLVLLISGVAVAWVWWNAKPKPMGSAYVGIGGLALWDGTGPVRRRLASLPYGEKVTVLDRYSDSVEVRTVGGEAGWVDEDSLIGPQTWEQLGDLASKVRTMTVQAEGHTAVLSNIHLAPGRTAPLVGQLDRNTPVEILARSVAPKDEGAATGSPSGGRGRMEAWLLVRAKTPQAGEVAGWMLGGFVADDPPAALAANLSAAGMRPVAWFALRAVRDPSQGPKPYYLMLGSAEPAASACDFTMLRVYTWSVPHELYETAFVQNELCGRLPVQVTLAPDRQRSVYFRFQNLAAGAMTILTYRMQDTLVKQVLGAEANSIQSSRGQRGGA